MLGKLSLVLLPFQLQLTVSDSSWVLGGMSGIPSGKCIGVNGINGSTGGNQDRIQA